MSSPNGVGKVFNLGGGNAVTSFNGRKGVVTPQAGDYTAEQVGARPSSWMPSAADVGAATMAQVNEAIETAITGAMAAAY